MKIIKRVGERLLPDWLVDEVRPVFAFAGAGVSLVSGSVVLAARAWAWLGERLDTWERLGACAAGVYVAGYGSWHAPHIARFAIPAAVVAWCAAAWWHAPHGTTPRPATASEPGDEGAAPHRGEAWRAFVHEAIGDRQGVHLRDLLDTLHQTGHHPDWEVADVRRVCEAAGVPVRNRVRVRGLGVTVGVHRGDLPALPGPSPESGGQTPPDSELHAS